MLLLSGVPHNQIICEAPLSTIAVTNTTELDIAISAAHGGDTITLAAGNYGDYQIKSVSFASDVTIRTQDAGNGAIFHTLSVQGSSHIHLDHITFNFLPTAATYVFSPAVKVENSDSIGLTNSTVTGGPAVTGVAQSASSLDATGNVLGLPTGYGVNIVNSSNVVLDHLEISRVATGISLSNDDHVTVSNNNIHDIRKTGIVGAGLHNVVIDSNHLHDSSPWHWGSGDHADFIALWTAANQTSPSENIHITNNVLDQGKGTAILGLWLQGGVPGFTNAVISNNAILDGNLQGINLWSVHNSIVDHNVLIQTSGDMKSAPGIFFSSGTTNVAVANNISGSVTDGSGAIGVLANSVSGTIFAQNANLALPAFYGSDIVTALRSLGDLTTIYSTAQSYLAGPLQAQAVSKALAAEALQLTTPGPGLVLAGGYTSDRMVGSGGNDVFRGGGGADTMIGGAGNDTYYVSAQQTVVEQANQGVDTVVTRGDYSLGANVENLTIDPTSNNNWSGVGNGLNNAIVGNAGNNYLDGGAGADTISGGLGNDRLTGGSGKDLFRFAPGDGDDVISDLSGLDHDAIDISAYLQVGLAPALRDVGSDSIIEFSNGDSITLTGVHVSSLISTTTGFSI